MVKYGCDNSDHGTLKLIVSQKWADGINWFLHAGTKSEKIKLIQWFWVGMVNNGHGLLVHESLESAYLKNEFMNWADFLNADSDAIIFG